MDKETVIALAQECQLIGMRPHLDGIYQEALERFAALVAAAERDLICTMLDDLHRQEERHNYYGFVRNMIREMK